MFSWSTTPRPIVALAPMAGVTDASYRRFMKKIAPEIIVITEFLSTDAIAYGAGRTMEMLAFDPAIERPFIVQIFGHDQAHFIEAAKIIEQLGADGIDINMGCPAAKIVSSCHGAALIRESALAAQLVAATVNAVSIPVSVKTRLGWDTVDGLIPFCTGLVEAGASALAIHGRRFCDKFTGTANWEPIYALKEALPETPVLGNGDIASATDAVSKIRNLDGVMVGRGTFGNPWVMVEIVDALREARGRGNVNTQIPKTFEQKIPFILDHCELAVSLKGERRGILEMRRHLNSYVKGFDGARELRTKLMTLEKFNDVKMALHAV